MNRRLLLVEDHDSLRRVMGSFFSEKFEVVGAKNGLEAMTWLSKGVTPDVIVTDTAMPVLDGEALLSNLRCSGLWAGIPVVVIGNALDDAEEMRYKSLGALAYFRKPFSPAALQQQILDLIG